jgi:amidase
MPATEIHYLEIAELAALIAAREVSPVEVADSLLTRISALEPKLHSFAHINPEAVRASARKAEEQVAARENLHPLHGIPIGIKDIFWTNDAPTAAGTTIHREFQPDHDATVVARLKDAGAIVIGKLQTTEGAYSTHHPEVETPINPWAPEYWAGASSSGSGVAPAAGLCYGALGSDTGGSIRLPCAANGLTGIKPTWGRVSRFGAFELAATMDHIGPMARSARDAALMLGVIAGRDDKDPTSLSARVPDYVAESLKGVAGLRVGIDRRWNTEDVDTEVISALNEASAVLKDLGAEIVEVVSPDPRAVIDGWMLHCGIETAIAHEATYPSRAEEYGPMLRWLIELGRSASFSDYQKLILARNAYRGELDLLFTEIDLFLVPVHPIAAPTIARISGVGSDPDISTQIVRYAAPFDMSGHPTITLPCQFNSDGVPIAFQLVSAHLREDLLCRGGVAFQEKTDWHRRHPTLIGI